MMDTPGGVRLLLGDYTDIWDVSVIGLPLMLKQIFCMGVWINGLVFLSLAWEFVTFDW